MPESFTDILAEQQERERYFLGVVGFMREDHAGLDAAITRMHRHVLGAFDDDEQFRFEMLQALNENEAWMRAKVEQARAIVALADGAP